MPEREPCLVCCPESDIPAGIKPFMLELRRDYPATILQSRAPLPGRGPTFGTRDECWNCRGARVVVVA